MDMRDIDNVVKRRGWALFFLTLLCFLPFQAAQATSSIANQVLSFCTPEPTMPDVNSCSACHSTNSPGTNDLTPEGMWAQSGAFINFCPNKTTTPPPGGGGGGTPAPTPGMGMGMSGGGSSGMGMGVGGSVDDDDDDDDEEDDDDDDDMAAPPATPLGSFLQKLGL